MGATISRHFLLGGAALVAAGAIGAGVWIAKPSAKPAAALVYAAEGFGGYVAPVSETWRKERDSTLLKPALDAYWEGRWQDAQSEAERIERAYRGKREGVLALRLVAYSQARRGEYLVAQQTFAELRDAAALLPDKGKLPNVSGTPEPTLEEEGAFQRIVCGAAVGDKQEAEQAYEAFLERYPNSILVAAAVKRVARMHGGNVPPRTERLRQAAMQIQKRTAEAEGRQRALCGPKCLAELLRRRGKTVSVAALAQEMGTSSEGTSLAQLASSAQKRGLKAQGLALTQAGLSGQSLPLLALVFPGHYVLVEAVSPQGVTVWDADAEGEGKAGTRSYSAEEWTQAWSGTALALK